ncbi:hypothetical protein ACO0LG_10940 [Undibacterium sp. Ji42W]|uniref:hypothetical protein n=1 Tax=Undibacterium sp. Ji42W TaxID=3413039 RepID=UPI003BF1F7C9
MEFVDPVDFSVWGRVIPGKVGDFRKWISNRINISQLAAHQLFGDVVKDGNLVQIHSDCNWSRIPAMLSCIPEFIEPGSVVVAATGIYPSKEEKYCEIHNVYFRLGACPVCTDPPA